LAVLRAKYKQENIRFVLEIPVWALDTLSPEEWQLKELQQRCFDTHFIFHLRNAVVEKNRYSCRYFTQTFLKSGSYEIFKKITNG